MLTLMRLSYKSHLHSGRFSSFQSLNFCLINNERSYRMVASRSYLRPCSILISCQDITKLYWQRVRKLWSIKKVIQVTSNSYTDISARTLNKSIYNTISRRGYHLVHRKSNHDQKDKSTLQSKRYIRKALATLSFSISGWFIIDNYVLQNQNVAIFDPTKFTPFEVIKKEIISPTAFLLTLRSSQKNLGLYDPDPFEKWWTKGIWSVEAKQPELQIARLYTPLPPLRGEPLDYITFLIRKEYRGEMAGYLDRLQKNSTIQLRGPYQEFEIPETVNKIIFLAGGTGISPALQIIHRFLERRSLEDSKPSIHIIWANRRREDCQGGGVGENENGIKGSTFSSHRENQNENPIVKYLQKMQRLHPDKLTIQYLVDNEGTVITPKTIEKLIKKDSEKTPENYQSQSRLVLVSGPEGFIEFIAGAKKWAGPQGQGELGGILRNVDKINWRVWKL